MARLRWASPLLLLLVEGIWLANASLLCYRCALPRMSASDRNADLPASHAPFFPPDADEATLKKRFKELAVDMHPDRMGSDAPEDAVERFQTLSEEYNRLLDECQTQDQRETLRAGWKAMGGLMTIIAVGSTEPALAVAMVGSLGSVALLSALADTLVPSALPSSSAVKALQPEGADGEYSAPPPRTLAQLYADLDAAIERQSYDEAAGVKAAIDEASNRQASIDEARQMKAAMQAGEEAAAARAAEAAATATEAAATEAAATEAAATDVAELTPIPLPEGLEAWGCDAALWGTMRQWRRKRLLNLLARGHEERGRMRIRRYRQTYDETASV